MLDKSDLTEQLVSSLPEEYAVSIEKAGLTWWHNIRAIGGLRLTHTGFIALHNGLELDHYVFHVDKDWFTPKHLLRMDRKLKSPYYIDTKTRKPQWAVYLFDSRVAMMAQLYGDWDSYLESL